MRSCARVGGSFKDWPITCIETGTLSIEDSRPIRCVVWQDAAAHAVPAMADVTVLKEALVLEEKVITMRVAACTAQVCEIAGVRPDGPAGQWIAEMVQNCCEEELDEALAQA